MTRPKNGNFRYFRDCQKTRDALARPYNGNESNNSVQVKIKTPLRENFINFKNIIPKTKQNKKIKIKKKLKKKIKPGKLAAAL